VAHADLVPEGILVQTRFSENDIVKLVPGAVYKSHYKGWLLPKTWPACIQLRAVFQDNLTIGVDLNTWAHSQLTTRIKPALALRTLLKPDYEPWPDDRLRAFQRAGVDFLRVAGSAVLGDDMGTGKTVQMLALLAELGEPNVLPTLVFCPNSAKLNWVDETRRWFPHATPYAVLGGAVNRKKILADAAQDPTALVSINYESARIHSRIAPYGSIRLKRCPDCGGKDPKVRHTQCEVCLRELNTIGWKTVIADEAHRIKDPHAKQTRAVWAVGQQESVRRRFPMTGTVIANDPSDLWSIMHFVAPDEYPVKGAFIERYCLMSWGVYGGLEVKGIHPERKKEFFQILDPRFRRVPKEAVLTQLPPKIRIKRYVELPPRQRKSYNDMKTTLAARLSGDTLMIAQDERVGWLRRLQFSSASMESTEDGGFRMCEPSPKLDDLMECLEELDGAQVVIAAEHIQLINLAETRLARAGITYGRITGTEKEFERHAYIRDFQAGKLRCMLLTMGAGSEAITLTAADTMIFLQRSSSMIRNQQTEGRINRIGAEKHESLRFIDIIATNTVEVKQIGRLHAKFERLEELNRDRAALAAANLTYDSLDVEEQKILAEELLEENDSE
jgi:SNF2 family DNA or RNA helicase